MKNSIIFSLILLVFSIPGFSQRDSKDLPKLTVEEIVAKHLTSIGAPEAIAAAKSRVMMGQGFAVGEIKTPKDMVGPFQLASDGNRMLLTMLSLSRSSIQMRNSRSTVRS